MVNPLISVKMLTYNHVQFIARAIESVLAQKTEYPFELVIGEDASTDGTRDIVFRYQQEFHDIIRVVTSDHNVGMKKNSYRTNKVCRGKYIAYCEGDDFWHHPSKLQKEVEYLEANPDCGMVFSSYDVHCPESGETVHDVIKHKKWTLPEKWDVETIVAGEVGVGRAIVTCTVAARLALVNRIIEDDSYLHQNTKFLMGDIQLWAALVSRSRAHYLPESLATYVLSSESATRSKNLIKLLKFNLSSSELALELCDKYKLRHATRTRCLKEWCEAALTLSFYTRDKLLAAQAWRARENLSIKNWCKYLGVQNKLVHFGFKKIASILNFYKIKKCDWL